MDDAGALVTAARKATAAAGRPPESLEITMGCPGAAPGSGEDPIAAIDSRRADGVERIALPMTAFMPDFESSIAAFGEQVIRQVSDPPATT